jgi:maleamate amidohydrolase
MEDRIWNKFLTERDKQVFAASGYGAKQGFGKRPVLVIVDVNYDFCGDKPEPILESIKRWRNSCGEEAWVAVKAIKKLLAAAREKGVPVVYTTSGRRPDNWDQGSWAWKNNRTAERVIARGTNLPGNTIVPDIAPNPEDIVLYKQKPSAFFATPLLSYLVLHGADSILLAGVSTSGCIRASVLDAFSNNFRVSVVEECCFDRSQASHAINLCDIHAKYGDVVKLEETLAFVATLRKGMYDLPKPIPSAA